MFRDYTYIFKLSNHNDLVITFQFSSSLSKCIRVDVTCAGKMMIIYQISVCISLTVIPAAKGYLLIPPRFHPRVWFVVYITTLRIINGLMPSSKHRLRHVIYAIIMNNWVKKCANEDDVGYGTIR